MINNKISVQETEGELIETNILNEFNGHEVSVDEFKDSILDEIIGHDVNVELQLNKRVLTGQLYENCGVDFMKEAIILDEVDNEEKIFTSIPIGEIDKILEGEGFVMQDHWLVRLRNGLDYFISVAW